MILIVRIVRVLVVKKIRSMIAIYSTSDNNKCVYMYKYMSYDITCPIMFRFCIVSLHQLSTAISKNSIHFPESFPPSPVNGCWRCISVLVELQALKPCTAGLTCTHQTSKCCSQPTVGKKGSRSKKLPQSKTAKKHLPAWCTKKERIKSSNYHSGTSCFRERIASRLRIKKGRRKKRPFWQSLRIELIFQKFSLGRTVGCTKYLCVYVYIYMYHMYIIYERKVVYLVISIVKKSYVGIDILYVSCLLYTYFTCIYIHITDTYMCNLYIDQCLHSSAFRQRVPTISTWEPVPL